MYMNTNSVDSSPLSIPIELQVKPRSVAPPLNPRNPDQIPIIRKVQPTYPAQGVKSAAERKGSKLDTQKEKARKWSKHQDMAYFAWSADLDNNNNATRLPNWTEFNKHIRRDQRNQLQTAIIPGESAMDLVITLSPIDVNPVSPEASLAIIKTFDSIYDITHAHIMHTHAHTYTYQTHVR